MFDVPLTSVSAVNTVVVHVYQLKLSAVNTMIMLVVLQIKVLKA